MTDTSTEAVGALVGRLRRRYALAEHTCDRQDAYQAADMLEAMLREREASDMDGRERDEATRDLAHALYEAIKGDDPANFVTAMDDDGEVTLDGQFNLFRIAARLRRGWGVKSRSVISKRQSGDAH
jgi:hypothetical protein